RVAEQRDGSGDEHQRGLRRGGQQQRHEAERQTPHAGAAGLQGRVEAGAAVVPARYDGVAHPGPHTPPTGALVRMRGWTPVRMLVRMLVAACGHTRLPVPSEVEIARYTRTGGEGTTWQLPALCSSQRLDAPVARPALPSTSDAADP